MTIQEMGLDYLAARIDAIDFIRRISGMFNPENAADILVMVCAITRLEQNDMDKDTFKEVYLGVKK